MKYYNVDPFLLATTPHPDFNQQDRLNDIDSLDRCNQAIEKFCVGKMPLSDLLDILEEEDVSAEEYADQVTSNIEYCMGGMYEKSQEGLLIPYGIC